MLWTIAAIVLFLWALGFLNSYTMGGFIPIVTYDYMSPNIDTNLSGSKNE
jgi:Family of unknown function (DUF5670)